MDFNGDNTVNIQDFLAFVAVFGQSVELKNLADYPVGVSLQTKYLTDDARVSIVKRTFSSITGGWEMKPKPISTGPGTYNWRRADALVDFAEANNMQVHGHTLLWHNAVPTWMENFSGDDAAFEAAIKEYITTVVQRYRGRVVSWDVVNEGIDGTGKVRDNLFSQRMGNDYIARLFQYAREADPDVLLFYNDYGTSQPWARAKRAGMLNMLDDFQTRGIPIDGVGLQMHISYKSPDISAIRETIDEIVRRGLKLHISETGHPHQSRWRPVRTDSRAARIAKKTRHRNRDSFPPGTGSAAIWHHDMGNSGPGHLAHTGWPKSGPSRMAALIR